MIQRRCGTGLLLEALQSLWIGGERGGQHLNRDFAPKPRIAGAMHYSHSSRANLGQDFVGANLLTCDYRHGGAL